MAKEIERKFLVTNDQYKKNACGTLYIQGYLNSDKKRVVRVRIMGDQAALTIKGPSAGLVRSEFEYAIPLKEAKELLLLCEKPLLKKIRYQVPFKGMVWEVDEFLEDNEGLVIAEIELESEGQPFDKPNWVGQEVTSDPRYYNSNLIHSPLGKKNIGRI